MKKIILLLILVSLSFSAVYEYDDPPLATVSSQNGITAGGLSDSLDAEHSKIDSLYLSWYGRSLWFNSSMSIAGLTLLVDNATAAGENTRVVIGKGGNIDHLQRKWTDGICNKAYFDAHGDDSNCDFDSDGCAEYEYSSDIFYTINITFRFGNLSETVAAADETVGVFGERFDNALTNTVSIPSAIENAMGNSSGNENLTLIFNGTATAVYGIDNRAPGGMGCISNNFGTFWKTISFGENRTYPVEGRHTLIFTIAPVLNEQWFRNNNFNNAVLSQSRIYRAKILMDGEIEKEFVLYGFNITENEYGLKEIISIENESAPFAGVVDVNPYVLDESNQSYAFLYLFNYSYEGLGENRLEIYTESIFGMEKGVNQTILSRQLSHNGNITETGSAYEFETTRKSSGFKTESLTLVRVGIGMLGVFIIVFFALQARK